MYQFERVVATAEQGRITKLDIYQTPDVFLDFKVAQKLANVDWLNGQLKKIEQSTTPVEVDLAIPGQSMLRGYQGGVMMVCGDWVYLPRRSTTAPSSPGMIDICAGRTISPNKESWASLIANEAEEVGLLSTKNIGHIKDGDLITPRQHYRDFSVDRYESSVKRASNIIGLGNATKHIFAHNELGANFTSVYVWNAKDDQILTTLEMSPLIVPRLSSIEAIQFVLISENIPGVVPFDTEFAGDKYLGRDTVAINRKEGTAVVYNRGTVKMQETDLDKAIRTMAAETNQTVPQILSEKVLFAIRDFPVHLKPGALEQLLTME